MQNKNKMYEVDLDELMSDEIAPQDEGMDMEYEAMHHGHDADLEEEISDLYESLSALFEADDEDGDAPLAASDEDEEEDEGKEEEDEMDDMGGDDAGGPVGSSEMEGGVADQLNTLISLIQDMKGEIDDIKASVESGGAGPEAPDMPDMPGAGMAPPSAGPAAPPMPPGADAGPTSETVYRVNESALMRELAALREGKALGTGFSAAKKAKLAGKALPEAVDGDEGMELDELADDLEGEPTAEGKGNGVPSSKGKLNPHKSVSAPFSEAAKTKVMKENRDLKVSLAKHAEAIDSLRGQLTEMNLFNAKLLYVNRLLQDRDLTDGQRRNIIESLDGARSLREVKLLYKGLSESIGRTRAGKGKPAMVTESVGSRSVSNTSRPLSTSGVRLNEAVEVHRWAVLAGINSKA